MNGILTEFASKPKTFVDVNVGTDARTKRDLPHSAPRHSGTRNRKTRHSMDPVKNITDFSRSHRRVSTYQQRRAHCKYWAHAVGKLQFEHFCFPNLWGCKTSKSRRKWEKRAGICCGIRVLLLLPFPLQDPLHIVKYV